MGRLSPCHSRRAIDLLFPVPRHISAPQGREAHLHPWRLRLRQRNHHVRARTARFTLLFQTPPHRQGQRPRQPHDAPRSALARLGQRLASPRNLAAPQRLDQRAARHPCAGKPRPSRLTDQQRITSDPRHHGAMERGSTLDAALEPLATALAGSEVVTRPS